MILSQTSNWDLNNDLDLINELLNQKLELGEKGISSMIIQGIKYMMVESTEERKIGTNITGKGHLIICPIPIGGTGALVCYINPQAGIISKAGTLITQTDKVLYLGLDLLFSLMHLFCFFTDFPVIH